MNTSDTPTEIHQVPSEENVARILSKEWFVKDKLLSAQEEPRDTHTKSHAGIFTRFQNANLKKGLILKAGPTSEEISADTVLLEVRKELLALSTVEDCKFK